MAAFSYIIKKCIHSHPSRYTLDTFSRLGEGFYSRALCKWRRYAAALAQPTEAFPSEGKVLNAVKRMRCSRRSGVILYIALLTAAAQPTPHQSALADSFSSRRSLLVSAFFNSR